MELNRWIMRNAGFSRLCWPAVACASSDVGVHRNVCTAIAACTLHTCNARDPLATMAMRGRQSVINSEHCQYLGYKRCGATVRNNEAIINETRLCGRGSKRGTARSSVGNV